MSAGNLSSFLNVQLRRIAENGGDPDELARCLSNFLELERETKTQAHKASVVRLPGDGARRLSPS